MAVARLTMYALFREVSCPLEGEGNRTRRVALEASANSRLRVGDLVYQPGGFGERGCGNRVLPRCGGPGADGWIVAGVVLDIPIFIDAGDKGDGLTSGSKGPLDRRVHAAGGDS